MVFFNGILQNKAPEKIPNSRGQLALRLNGVVKAVLPLKPVAGPLVDGSDSEDETDIERGDEGPGNDDLGGSC